MGRHRDGPTGAEVAPAGSSLLSHDQVIRLLVGCGLLSPGDVVGGAVEVAHVERRHRIFRVARPDGQGFFVKQGVGSRGMAAVAQEASVCRYLDGAGVCPGARAGLRHHDADRGVAVFDLIAPGDSLRSHQVRTRRVSLALAAALGATLARLHRANIKGPGSASPGHPEILSFSQPSLAMVLSCSPAMRNLLAILQSSPGSVLALETLKADWRPDRLIHGDVRWDNCVVESAPGRRRTRLRLVDWEHAVLGDCAWDLGSAFADYVAAWVTSIPVASTLPPDRGLPLAGVPLARVQPAVRALWQAYRTIVGSEAEDRLPRAIRLAGARLLQCAFEHVDRSAWVTGAALTLLQVGANVLECPERARRDLLSLAA